MGTVNCIDSGMVCGEGTLSVCDSTCALCVPRCFSFLLVEDVECLIVKCLGDIYCDCDVL